MRQDSHRVGVERGARWRCCCRRCSRWWWWWRWCRRSAAGVQQQRREAPQPRPGVAARRVLRAQQGRHGHALGQRDGGQRPVAVAAGEVPLPLGLALRACHPGTDETRGQRSETWSEMSNAAVLGVSSPGF